MMPKGLEAPLPLDIMDASGNAQTCGLCGGRRIFPMQPPEACQPATPEVDATPHRQTPLYKARVRSLLNSMTQA